MESRRVVNPIHWKYCRFESCSAHYKNNINNYIGGILMKIVMKLILSVFSVLLSVV